MTSKKEEIESKAVALVDFYRKNPIIAAQDLLNVDLVVPQQRILEDMWFNNYVLVTAGRGCGKCVRGKTLLITDKGIVKIEDLGSKLHPLCSIDMDVSGLNGKEKASKWYFDGNREVIDLTTKLGFEIGGTEEHRIVINHKDSVGWLKIGLVSVGEKVALELGADLWGKAEYMSTEAAYSYGQGLAFKNKARFSTEKYRDLFIGKSILASNKRVILSFLKGFLDNSSLYEDRGTLWFMDQGLLSEMRVIFSNLGILTNTYREGSSYRLEVVEDFRALFDAYFFDVGSVEEELGISRTNLFQGKYYFDEIVSKSKSFDDVYDLVVPETHSFSANGFVNHNTFVLGAFACLSAMLYPGQKVGLLAPSFRQSKFIFAEVEKIWSKAPILQEATTGRPTKASDKCYLNFKTSGRSPPSVIEAIPLGDGGLIRGARYFVILADEFAQIPSEIFNTVITPMGATTLDPMENVRKRELQAKLIEKGIDISTLEEPETNKIIMTSSAYYQFNHMYNQLQTYKRHIQEGIKGYAVNTVSYRSMPPGFLSENNIREAQSNSTKDQFMMEYEAIWLSDSSGIFKASLVENCTKDSSFTVKLKGDTGKEYVLGVDPARTKDGFTICVIELDRPNKVVAAYEYYKQDFPKMSQIIMDVCDKFNVIRIHMDAGGGGLAIKDLLEEHARFGARVILDMDDEKNKNREGRKILKLANFGPRFISEMNYHALNLMEKGALHFPKPPQLFNINASQLEDHEEIFGNIQKTKEQLVTIEVRENASGGAKFDLPEGSGDGHGKQKKDLYTAFVLAAKAAYDLNMPSEDTSFFQGGIVESIHSKHGRINSDHSPGDRIVRNKFNR
jgi:hypothetical protein